MKQDITSRLDIEVLVNEFYTKVRADNILGDLFNGIIGDRWPEHLEKMYRFWQTILLQEHTYVGNPFAPHAVMPLKKVHFQRWTEIFHLTVDSRFEGPLADEAKWRADKMAEMFLIKINHVSAHKPKPLV